MTLLYYLFYLLINFILNVLCDILIYIRNQSSIFSNPLKLIKWNNKMEAFILSFLIVSVNLSIRNKNGQLIKPFNKLETRLNLICVLKNAYLI